MTSTDLSEVLFTASSSALGPQVIELPPFRVFFLAEFTHVSRYESRIELSPRDRSSQVIYGASVGGNKVLRSIGIHAYSNKDCVPAVLAALGLLDKDSDCRVAQVLAPQLPSLDATFLRSPSRTPRLIGAIFDTNESAILFYFGLFRGALASKALPAELQRSLRVEMTSREEK